MTNSHFGEPIFSQNGRLSSGNTISSAFLRAASHSNAGHFPFILYHCWMLKSHPIVSESLGLGRSFSQSSEIISYSFLFFYYQRLRSVSLTMFISDEC